MEQASAAANSCAEQEVTEKQMSHHVPPQELDYVQIDDALVDAAVRAKIRTEGAKVALALIEWMAKDRV